jgi:hypothetical protein
MSGWGSATADWAAAWGAATGRRAVKSNMGRCFLKRKMRCFIVFRFNAIKHKPDGAPHLDFLT